MIFFNNYYDNDVDDDDDDIIINEIRKTKTGNKLIEYEKLQFAQLWEIFLKENFTVPYKINGETRI